MSRRRVYKYRRGPFSYISLPKLNISPDIKRGIFIVFILAAGAIGFLSLFDLAGVLGEYFLRAMMFLFGWGKYFVPLLLLALGFFMYHRDRYWVRGASYLGLFLFTLSVCTFFHLLLDPEVRSLAASDGSGGGWLGMIMSSVFLKIMGFWASLIVVISLFLISFMLMFNAGLADLVGREGWLGKILYPFFFIFNRLFRREQYGEEEEEEELLDDEEEKSEPLAEEEELLDEETGFSQKQVKAEADSETAPREKREIGWKKTNLKIDLPLDLLSGKVGKPTSGDIKNNIAVIERTLANFGIAVEMAEVSVGPTVTQYTFKPAEGIKLSRITTLSNDLALSLAAHPIRIEAPIPGKSLVGIEVPNQTKAIVGLREILESPEFKARKSGLTIALGKDVAGRSWVYDISRMPHLLVAGATNSGKSVCLNSIIVSLLYQNSPDELKFLLVDPKRVELPVYNGIPYLLTPVITDVNKTINALRWCLNEMDRRFDVLSRAGKRNIQIYNEAAERGRNGVEKMPYIVFIIDELADLMVVAARDVEAAVVRLAQMARAVGIHLVLATQRPSVDVITGLIKANMPARIAFSVASSVDSRTILDSLGAEKLLGSGDMLFTTAELSKPKRIQGAFVADLEIRKVARYIREKAGEPEYLEDIVERQKVKGLAGVGMEGAEESDDLVIEAKELVIYSQKASASFLQRKLSVGYARAARILDILEEMGVVGPANGAKPREILLTREQFERIQSVGVSGVPLHNREEAEEPEEYLDTGEEGAESEDEEMEEVEEIKEEEDWSEDKKEEKKSEKEENSNDEERYFSK